MASADAILSTMSELLPESDGFECHQFKIGSYNALTASYFRLPYEEDVMGILVLNTPSFLESTFKKWLLSQRKGGETVNDLAERFGSGPMQSYFCEKFANVQKQFLPIECDVIHDFDMHPNRRPKILMSTCGHAAGAAFLYRPDAGDADTSTRSPTAQPPVRRIGLSLHAKYGGHFAFRAVFVFKDVRVGSSFKERVPVMRLKTIEEQLDAIELFNRHWRDGRFRDCGDPVERYSDLQMRYYSVPPLERWTIIAHWFDEDPVLDRNANQGGDTA